MERILFLTLVLVPLLSFAAEIKKKHLEIFPNAFKIIPVEIKDKVSAEKNNKQMLKVLSRTKKVIGFIREISTTTGCNSACLPLIYTTYYSKTGELIKLKSAQGLTKINHTPFTEDDYAQLDLILAMAPKEFSHINHPKELTDALSGETLKVYKPVVVKGAAYSTLRIHLYNQETKKWIQDLKK